MNISLLCSCRSASVPVLLATFLIHHFLTAFLISGLVKRGAGDRTNACLAVYFQRAHTHTHTTSLRGLSVSSGAITRGPEALETAADSNWGYALHQRNTASSRWALWASLHPPGSSNMPPRTHLLLILKAAAAIYPHQGTCGSFLSTLDGHGQASPQRTITPAFHVLAH